MAKRIVWQDAAKGLGIILVVFGHTERGLRDAHMIGGSAWAWIDFALYTFHMPLFMFLSGLNVPRSLEKGTGRFVRGKMLTIAYPYVLWALLQSAVMVLLSRFINHGIGWGQLATIGWRPPSQFWFLYVLFVLMMIVAIVPRRLFVALAILALAAALLFKPGTLPFQLLHFPLFLAGGWIVGARGGPAQSLPWTIGVAGGLVAAIAIGVAIALGFTNPDSVVMLPAAVGGIALCMWLAQRSEKIAVLVRIGELSMAIYLMHILAGAGMRIVLARAGHLPLPDLLYPILCSVAAIVLPIVAYLVLARMKLLPWLGLSVGPRGKRWVAGGEDPLMRPSIAA